VSRSTPPRRAVRAGIAAFLIGLVFIAVDVTPFFFHHRDTPLWLNLACLLAPIGFGVAVWSGLAAGRAEQREAAEATRHQTD
jgi:hypothetical protein